jgi:hypothetical protein
MSDVVSISKTATEFSKQFSICCIVNNEDEYAQMQHTFLQNGFNDDCEYLIADNINGNQFDAYEAINHFIQKANGKYIIVVHQDVRVIDHKSTLLDCIATLDNIDPHWAVCGNAGGITYHEKILYLRHANEDSRTTKKLPQKVRTLDENFLMIKNDALLSVSIDLSGFHLYGTDICLLAQMKGYTCYVIPYLVQHLSEGNLKDLYSIEKSFIKKYGKKIHLGFIQTTCTRFYLSNSPGKNLFFNHPFIFFFVKIYFGIRRGIFKLFKKEL